MPRMSACAAIMFAGESIFIIMPFAPTTRDNGAAFRTERFPDISTDFVSPARGPSAPMSQNKASGYGSPYLRGGSRPSVFLRDNL